ncbi:MAG: MATE family efflux transporter [Agathobacter sp.]|nr:MATE family efflux transporter [Agathobacter sp.]
MSGKQLSKDFTKGNIPKQLLVFMLPFMASNALQVLYATVDMVIVGKFVGTAGLSAVSQSSLIIGMPTMFYLGFANAGQILLSQALGAKRKDEVNRIIGNMFTVILLMGLILSGVLLAVRKPALGLMNIPAESYDMAMQYVVICGAGLIFTAGYNLISAIMRGMGDSQRPLLFIGIATAVNIVLDLLFTGLLGWGVAGAAWATIIGQAVSFLFSLYYLYKRKEAFGFDFKWSSYKPQKNIVKMMISLGTPMAIQSGCINLSMLVVNSMINGMGVVASATFGVGCKIDDIINKISMGIQFAAMPMISQNFGAGEKERCKKVVYNAWIFAIIFTAICMTLYITMGRELFMLFSDDPLVHEMSETFIKAILWMFPAFVIMRGSSALVSGVGNAKLGLVLSLLDGVILRIGLSWLFGIGLDLGFYGFVLGYGLAPYGFSVPGLIYFLSGKWEKRKTLVEQM